MSHVERASNPTRASGFLCFGIGLLFGALGTLWIFQSHRWPERAVQYHVPLAIVFGTFAAHLVLSPLDRTRLPTILGAALALGCVALRMAFAWPLSGHGILASFIVLLAPWWQLQAAAFLILPQAVLTKWVRNEDPESVIFGALAGLGLAALVLTQSRPKNGLWS